MSDRVPFKVYWPSRKPRTTVRVDRLALDDLAEVAFLIDQLAHLDPEVREAIGPGRATKGRAAGYAFALARELLTELVARLDAEEA